MLIYVDHHCIAFFLGNGDGANFGIEVTGFLRSHGLGLTGQSHAVLVFAVDFEIGRDVFSRFGHGVHAVFFFHQLIDKAPANRRVIDRVAAAKRALGFGHDKRCAAHALDAAGNHHAGFACFDRSRGSAHRVHTRTAQTVDSGARQFHRQTCQQTRHMRYVAVVFTSLVNAAVNQIGHGHPIDLGVTGHQGLKGNGG